MEYWVGVLTNYDENFPEWMGTHVALNILRLQPYAVEAQEMVYIVQYFYSNTVPLTKDIHWMHSRSQSCNPN
jgi:hypothetical protein